MVWRAHKRRYDATDYGGTLLASGRWHVAKQDPDYVSGPAWPALYTSLDLATCAFEVQRIITRGGGSIDTLRDYRYSELSVRLQVVIDSSDPAQLGLTAEDLLQEGNYAIPRAVALAGRVVEAEALLVPSASRIGHNLIIFPDLKRQGSVIAVRRSLAPHLGAGRAADPRPP